MENNKARKNTAPRRSGYIYSIQNIWLAVAYLKNSTPDNLEMEKYTHEWVCEFASTHSGSPDDLWRDLFMYEKPLKSACEKMHITMIDQLIYYGREQKGELEERMYSRNSRKWSQDEESDLY